MGVGDIRKYDFKHILRKSMIRQIPYLLYKNQYLLRQLLIGLGYQLLRFPHGPILHK